MASTDHQLTLCRSSAHLHHHPIVPPNVAEKSKGPPAYIRKLFKVVNDPKTTDIIAWSFAGDSFFVLDYERLEREVLPYWFKHQHFSGFACQLRMYGFHRIQQGVLRSDTKCWNFVHPDFIRGHPELLLRIRRKKQIPQKLRQADEAAALVADGNGNSVVGVGSSRSGLTGANPSTALTARSRL